MAKNVVLRVLMPIIRSLNNVFKHNHGITTSNLIIKAAMFHRTITDPYSPFVVGSYDVNSRIYPNVLERVDSLETSYSRKAHDVYC